MEDIKVLQHNLRKRVARDIAWSTGYAYDKVLKVLGEDFKFFSRWDRYELNNRPVDVERIADFVAEYIDQ